MKKIIGQTKGLWVSLLAFGLPVLASAQATPSLPTNGNVPYAPITKAQNLLMFMCTIFSWLFYFLVVLAVLFIVIGAYRYLTSADNSEKVKGATNTLLYAAIAVAVALLAKAIPSIVADFLGATTSGGFLAC